MSIHSRRNFLKISALAGLSTVGGYLIHNQIKKGDELKKIAWYVNPESVHHTILGQLENHLRIEAVSRILNVHSLEKEVLKIESRQASFNELSLAHSKTYIKEIKKWDTKKSYYRADRWSPYSTPHAYIAAAEAAGSSIDLIQNIYENKLIAGFATIRPPGHHATYNQPLGYCIFNNIAVGIKSLQSIHPQARVAIIDIDAHHGNGLQDIFYDDPNVLYLSIHQDEWPFTGKIEHVGKGKGVGTNINIPLPAWCGDMSYKKIIDEIITLALNRFQPEMIVVATGYDTHWKDPQSFLSLSTAGQAHLCAALNSFAKQICHGKIAYILEGGYQLEALASGVFNTFQTLLDRSSFVDLLGDSPYSEPNIEDHLKKIKRTHKI